ncbi:hypothetical protein THASP1DRAFT_29278 [Thamnocephalis sphaerospora]|uniref:Ion transport domain-containing protein n=1 Tax=Thamnocephalis sphaerospora TaxID=78915 RepID=A0A4P9XS34_9FUNG|nr:hypothetical protein THASP1DRAFT_29278 [Thamnocephalis sphaerospora]|eukprot:RKP08934.1 hypothetical protein THASP1DRAFT_29278 [Thamnocephalis sphaerospora]
MPRSVNQYLNDADGNEAAASVALEMTATRSAGAAMAYDNPPRTPKRKRPRSHSIHAHRPSARSFELFPVESPAAYGEVGEGLDAEMNTVGGYIDIPDPGERNRTAASIHSPWKRQFYLLMEDPSSSGAAFFVNVFVVLMIVLSAVIATVETIPKFRSGETPIWFALETAVVVLLALEFAARVFAHSDQSLRLIRFMLSPLSIIDFSVVLLYFVSYILGSDTTYVFRITILRLFRLFRVFRVYRHSSLLQATHLGQLSIEVMIVAIKRSTDALSALLFFMLMTIIIFSSILYFAERGVWDDDRRMFLTSDGLASQFDSIPAVFWFVIVTITTTGYGDMVPQTFIGKVVAFPAMMIGILLIALPSIIVGRHFTIVWEAMKERQREVYRRERADTMNEDDAEHSDYHEDHDDTASDTSRRKELVQLRRQVNELTTICQQNQNALRQLLAALK